MSGIRWTLEEYERWKAKSQNRAATAVTNLESNPDDESAPAAVGQEISSRVCIHVHSRRRRLCDPDGISAKAAIDGLCQGGLLGDDSPAHVKAVTFSQEQAEVEETVIELWEEGE